ncbi:hypothetical protein EI94DRAFT_1747690 [Lactarius quietus]|nr:hypothetical protein EI94DRAFT_1747690 [Lactarius quietus]
MSLPLSNCSGNWPYMYLAPRPPTEKYPRPSYRNMMSHIRCATNPYFRRPISGCICLYLSSALHENAREPHTYTRQQQKEGNSSDGELDDFQEPKLSSLSKMNMDDIFPL